MKYKILFWINIVFLLAAVIFLWYLFENMKNHKTRPTIDRTLVQRLNNSEDYISFLPELYEIDGECLGNQSTLNFDGDTIVLSSISRDRNAIVLYVSSLQCKDCVAYGLSLVGVMNNEFGSGNVFVLYDGFSQREMAGFKKDNDLDNIFLKTISSNQKTILDEAAVLKPIIFVLSFEGEIKYPYMPLKFYDTTTMEYIDVLKDKLKIS